jgi:acyl-CoA reductase-like NAD-dependent aldehyde dehydrogenase
MPPSHGPPKPRGGGPILCRWAGIGAAAYVDPVVLVDVPKDSVAVTEETFGPLPVVNRVRDMDEAVERANAGGYGLGATVFARKGGAEIAARLRCGMVSVNSVIAFAVTTFRSSSRAMRAMMGFVRLRHGR